VEKSVIIGIRVGFTSVETCHRTWSLECIFCRWTLRIVRIRII